MRSICGRGIVTPRFGGVQAVEWTDVNRFRPLIVVGGMSAAVAILIRRHLEASRLLPGVHLPAPPDARRDPTSGSTDRDPTRSGGMLGGLVPDALDFGCDQRRCSATDREIDREARHSLR